MLECREWLKQRKEERKKGGCRVMCATVSPLALWCRQVHHNPLHPSNLSHCPPTLSSGTECSRGTCNRTQWDNWDSCERMRSLWLWWFLSMIECTTPHGFWFLDLMSHHHYSSCSNMLTGLWIIQIYLSTGNSWQTKTTGFIFCVSSCYKRPKSQFSFSHSDMQTHTCLTLVLWDSQGGLLNLKCVWKRWRGCPLHPSLAGSEQTGKKGRQMKRQQYKKRGWWLQKEKWQERCSLVSETGGQRRRSVRRFPVSPRRREVRRMWRER